MNTSESESPQEPSGLQVELGAKRTGHFRTIWLVPLLAVAAIVTGAVAWLSAQPSGPPIQWSPSEPVEFLLPSEKKTLTVHFRSNQNLSSLAVALTPSLSSVVSASPLVFPSVQANREYTLTLTLTAPSESQVKFDGTVHLKDGSLASSATYARPLPLTLVVHNEPVPPDPGESGNATLEGIDSDADGIRDDVQRWIVLNYYASKATQLALSQHTEAYQLLLAAADSSETSLAQVSALLRAVDCLYYVRSTDSHEVGSSLKAVVLNTELRSVTWVKANKHLSGQVFPLIPEGQEKFQCDFDPDAL